MIRIIQQLWLYRTFITGSVKREFQSRYLNSLLGVTWTFIQPLTQIAVYTLVFSQIMGAKLPGVEGGIAYSIYLCSGIIAWGLFSEIVSRSQNTFIEHANLIKKLNFPKLCLPVTVVLTALLNFAIIFGLFTLLLLITDRFPGWIYLLLLPVLVIQIIFSVGLGMTLGVLNVFFRDVGQAFTVVLQLWFWMTPIVYPISTLPEWVQRILILNPMTGLIGAYQTILVRGELPDSQMLIPVFLMGIFFCLTGFRLFRKHSGELVDEL